MKEFKNVTTMTDLKHSPWGGYTGQCVGRVIHYLYHYLGYNYADASQISSTEVMYWGKKIADLSWDTGFPLFRFTDDLPSDLRFIASRRQESNMDSQIELSAILEDFEMVLNKGLEYAQQDKTFPHNKAKMLEIKKKYFKEQ